MADGHGQRILPVLVLIYILNYVGSGYCNVCSQLIFDIARPQFDHASPLIWTAERCPHQGRDVADRDIYPQCRLRWYGCATSLVFAGLTKVVMQIPSTLFMPKTRPSLFLVRHSSSCLHAENADAGAANLYDRLGHHIWMYRIRDFGRRSACRAVFPGCRGSTFLSLYVRQNMDPDLTHPLPRVSVTVVVWDIR